MLLADIEGGEAMPLQNPTSLKSAPLPWPSLFHRSRLSRTVALDWSKPMAALASRVLGSRATTVGRSLEVIG